MLPRWLVSLTVVCLSTGACTTARDVTTVDDSSLVPTTTGSQSSDAVPEQETIPRPAGSLVTEAGPTLTVLAPDGSSPRHLPGAIDGGQPTWSPDGTQIVWSTTDGSAQPIVTTTELGSESTKDTPAPFFPFYYSWSPTGERIGMLGNGSSGTIEFAILDVEDGAIKTIDTGAPFYFDWSPDGESVVAHVGNSELRVIDAASGAELSSVPSSGLFQAPQWTELGILFQESTASSIQARGVVMQRSTTQRIVLGDPGGDVEELAKFDGASAFAARGDMVAYLKPSVLSTNAGPAVWVKQIDGPEQPVLASGVLAFQWSPNGRRLLVLEATVEPQGPRLRWSVWSDGELIRFESFAPTLTFLSRYLPFWDQYNRSISIWSPDGDSFVYTAEIDGASEVFVQRVADGVAAERIGTGEFASWSPAPRDQLSS